MDAAKELQIANILTLMKPEMYGRLKPEHKAAVNIVFNEYMDALMKEQSEEAEEVK